MATSATIETVASAPSNTFRVSLQEDAAGKAVMNQRIPRPPTFEDKYEEREYLKGRLRPSISLANWDLTEALLAILPFVIPSAFWVNPFGIAFSMKRSDLILVDHDSQVIDRGPYRLLNVAAYRTHSAVHAARPDVICVAHSHSIYALFVR